MTGELADLFPDRATGVARLIEAALSRPARRPDPRSGPVQRGFVAPAEAAGLDAAIASANWLASADARRAHAWATACSSTSAARPPTSWSWPAAPSAPRA